MASQAVFTSAGVIGSIATPSTLDTSQTAPTHTATVVTGATAGTKIDRVTFSLTGTTGGTCYVHLFIVKSGTFSHIGYFPLGSANSAPFVADKFFRKLILPDNTYALACSNTVANLGIVTAFGGSLA